MPTDVSNNTRNNKPFKAQFLLPRYWGIWLLMVVLLPLLYLPLSWQFAFGRMIGKLIFYLGKSRRNVTIINLQLAFPKKNNQQHYAMAKEVFVNQGVGIFEMLGAWYRPNSVQPNITIEGLEHIKVAQQQNKAVILLGGHYTILDLAGRLFSRHHALDGLYRPQNNDLLEWLIYKCRNEIFDTQIASNDMKSLIRRIKSGHVIWYAPDQDYGLKQGVMAPFFDVPAATVTAPRKLVTINKENPAAVMGFYAYRSSSNKLRLFEKPSYHITLTPPLDHYPSNDEVADATRINKMLADFILLAPTQWMWFHKRFKNCETGRTSYYDK